MIKRIKSFVEKYFAISVDNVHSITPGASARQYFRVWLDGKSFVVSWTEDRQAFVDFLDIQSYLQKIDLPVPQILATDQKKQLILQSDGGDQTLKDAVNQFGIENEQIKSLYFEAVDLILRMQTSNSSCVAFSRSFDFDKFWFEYTFHVQKYLLNGFLKTHLSEKEAHLFEDFYRDLAHTLADTPHVFCHRDFQSSNLLVTAENKLIVVDFQDARLGLAQYDLASLLADAYVPLTDDFQQILLDYYLNQFEEKRKITIDRDRFMKYYELTVIQRKLHDAGAFARAFCELGKRDFLQYIPECLEDVLKIIEESKYDHQIF